MKERTEFRAAVEAAIERDDPSELMDVISRVALDSEEREWAQSCCVQLCRHRNAMVRGNAIAGFGHLARRFGRMDARAIKRRIEIGLHDRNDYVRQQARSAAEDLRTFLAWEFEWPDD